jgi:hypothetical protein
MMYMLATPKVMKHAKFSSLKELLIMDVNDGYYMVIIWSMRVNEG